MKIPIGSDREIPLAVRGDNEEFSFNKLWVTVSLTALVLLGAMYAARISSGYDPKAESAPALPQMVQK